MIVIGTYLYRPVLRTKEHIPSWIWEVSSSHMGRPTTTFETTITETQDHHTIHAISEQAFNPAATASARGFG
ncbi:Hypp1267 [Branchiostoma lanceolatum]|uniref:Hypp1267 protein n=1 Tax=Branchiostoma lanceolatum TaxID=7740 RepID=A0A8J9ZHR2_BRALA|nr:Hypp1267 [Branchiostoma lanceolatum]